MKKKIMTQAQANLQSNKQNTFKTAGRRVKDIIRKNTLLVFNSNSLKTLPLSLR